MGSPGLAITIPPGSLSALCPRGWQSVYTEPMRSPGPRSQENQSGNWSCGKSWDLAQFSSGHREGRPEIRRWRWMPRPFLLDSNSFSDRGCGQGPVKTGTTNLIFPITLIWLLSPLPPHLPRAALEWHLLEKVETENPQAAFCLDLTTALKPVLGLCVLTEV